MDEFTVWICGFYEGEVTICNDISNNNTLRICIFQVIKYVLIMNGGCVNEQKLKSSLMRTAR